LIQARIERMNRLILDAAIGIHHVSCMTIGRLSPRSILRLFQRDLPRPVDVINLITVADLESYRWYGLFVAPLVFGLGGSVPWGGQLEMHLHGPRVADRLLVVRYPSHRVWLGMITNPYYIAINKFRERGVERFEASFASARKGESLRGQERLLTVCFDAKDDGALERMLAEVKAVGGDLAYAAHEVATIDLFKSLAPTDPNPLRFKRVAFFGFPSCSALGLAIDEGIVARLTKHAGECAVQVYRREPLKAHFPRVLTGEAREPREHASDAPTSSPPTLRGEARGTRDRVTQTRA
jgi:hypothetical protein